MSLFIMKSCSDWLTVLCSISMVCKETHWRMKSQYRLQRMPVASRLIEFCDRQRHCTIPKPNSTHRVTQSLKLSQQNQHLKQISKKTFSLEIWVPPRIHPSCNHTIWTTICPAKSHQRSERAYSKVRHFSGERSKPRLLAGILDN